MNVDITAKRVESIYRVNMRIGSVLLPVKYDTGAKYTVISAKVFNSELTDENLSEINNYCEKKCNNKERFISASGHSFYGYLVEAHNVKMGNTLLESFRYYLVVENKRDIALLGFDFIDSCKGSFEPHKDIVISEFDEEDYNTTDGAMDNDEVITFIDSLTVNQ